MQELLFSRIAGDFATGAPKLPEPGVSYTVLAANVQNPGADRATRLVEWLADETFDIIVLSELQAKPACLSIVSELRAQGYQTTSLEGADRRQYHTVVASRVAFEELPVTTSTLANRVKVAKFEAGGASLYLVGVYGVTFNDQNKDLRRRYKVDFENRILQRLSGRDSGVAITGDLNILEPRFHGHVAMQVADDRRHYQAFERFGFVDGVRASHPDTPEYSWFSPRTREGQRLDHLFFNKQARLWIDGVAIRHDIRLSNLSDHSAIVATLTLPGA